MTDDLAQRWVKRLLERLLERLLPGDVGEAFIGDLLEERALRARAVGARRAALWFWGQIARSAVPVLAAAFRRLDALAWVVAFVAYSLASAAETAARESVAPVATHTAVDAIPVLIIYLGAIVLAAYVVGRVRAEAALGLGLLVGLDAVLEIVTAADGMPSWYAFLLPVAGPAAVCVGGALFAHWSRGASARRRRRKTVA